MGTLVAVDQMSFPCTFCYHWQSYFITPMAAVCCSGTSIDHIYFSIYTTHLVTSTFQYQQQQTQLRTASSDSPKKKAKDSEERSFDVTFISHSERYSDLSKSAFISNGARSPKEDLTGDFVSIHPYAALNLDRVREWYWDMFYQKIVRSLTSCIQPKRGMPNGLTLEPRDSLALYRAMTQTLTLYPLTLEQAEQLKRLDPELFFKALRDHFHFALLTTDPILLACAASVCHHQAGRA